MTFWKKTVAIALLVLGLGLLNYIAKHLPGQTDWTGEKLYSLSTGSKAILEKLEEPIELRFYFSRSLEGLPTEWKNFATRVEDLLAQYVKAGKGAIRLSIIDPKPDSDEESEAIQAGIQAVPVSNGDNLFFGLQAVMADQEEVIDFFNRDREPYLEYDISQVIYQVQLFDRPVVGIITALPAFGSPQMPGMPPNPQASQEWAFIQELRKTWEVRQITGDSLSSDLDVLAIIHPGDLSQELRFEIDQYFMEGNPMLVALDPSSYVQRSEQQRNQQQMMMMGGMQNTASDLPQLLSSYGVAFDRNQVAGDLANGRLIGGGPAGGSVQLPTLLDITDFNKDLPPTTAINELTLMEPGSFSLNDGIDHELIPLIQTSEQGGTVAASSLNFTPLQMVGAQFSSDNQVRTLAGMIRGQFQSAFPDGLPQDGESEDATQDNSEPLQALAQSPPGTTLLFIADSDVFADAFSVRYMNFLGMQAIQPLNDNMTFTANLVDFIGGSQDLLEIRGKGRVARPFTRIETMELAAQTRYQQELDSLETKLSNVRDNLNQLQQEQGNQQVLVASPQALQAIEDYRLQEAQIRQERREIRKKLREDIESMEISLALFNLLTVPLFLGIFGVTFFTRRNNRRLKK